MKNSPSAVAGGLFFCVAGMGSFAPRRRVHDLSPMGIISRLRARDGEFRAPARVTFFFCKKKVTKENHSNLRSKDPWRGAGKCEFGGVYSRAGCSGHHCRSKGLCLRSPARRLPRPLASATVGVFSSTGWAIIKSRLCRRKAAKVGVPVGHRI